jgi:hypothetical protein
MSAFIRFGLKLVMSVLVAYVLIIMFGMILGVIGDMK